MNKEPHFPRPTMDLSRHAQDYVRHLIESKRDELTDEQLAVLFALYEEGNAAKAAASLAMSLDEIEDIFDSVARRPKSAEARKRAIATNQLPDTLHREHTTKQSRPRMRRISREALRRIISNVDELAPDERQLLQTYVESPNQSIASRRLSVSLPEFEKAYMGIRKRHGF